MFLFDSLLQTVSICIQNELTYVGVVFALEIVMQGKLTIITDFHYVTVIRKIRLLSDFPTL